MEMSDQLKLEQLIEALILNIKLNLANGSSFVVCIETDEEKREDDANFYSKARVWLEKESSEEILMWHSVSGSGKREKHIYDISWYKKDDKFFEYLRSRLGQLLALLKPYQYRIEIDLVDEKIKYRVGEVRANCTMKLTKIHFGD